MEPEIWLWGEHFFGATPKVLNFDALKLEYDEAKNQTNLRKHSISILELATIFENPFIAPTMDVPDVVHSLKEKRYHAYGWTTSGWYVKIWYTYRGETIRIIGGRKLK